MHGPHDSQHKVRLKSRSQNHSRHPVSSGYHHWKTIGAAQFMQNFERVVFRWGVEQSHLGLALLSSAGQEVDDGRSDVCGNFGHLLFTGTSDWMRQLDTGHLGHAGGTGEEIALRPKFFCD
jgi:hypothetical protein